LNATEVRADCARENFDEERFGSARNAFDQSVPFDEQGYEHLLYHGILAHDDFLQLALEMFNDCANGIRQSDWPPADKKLAARCFYYGNSQTA
jgi:hypothetical protein